MSPALKYFILKLFIYSFYFTKPQHTSNFLFVCIYGSILNILWQHILTHHTLAFVQHVVFYVQGTYLVPLCAFVLCFVQHNPENRRSKTAARRSVTWAMIVQLHLWSPDWSHLYFGFAFERERVLAPVADCIMVMLQFIFEQELTAWVLCFV